MKISVKNFILVASLLLNLIAIPWLGWKLLGYDMMYRRNVDYAAELAFAVGYHRGTDADLDLALADLPTRLDVTEVKPNSVKAVIWPRHNQSIILDFEDPPICYASLVEE